MNIVGILVALVMIGGVLVEAFEAIVLPRRVTRRFRFSRLYYRLFWRLWRDGTLALVRPGKLRETCLSWFGPFSLIGLFVSWFVGLILGFGLLMASMEMRVRSDAAVSWWTYFYLSGVTFFTLGFGDVIPSDPTGQTLVVIEAGIGFGFLALMVSYLPVLFTAFAEREVSISMLDARAGSPPSAGQLLLRSADGENARRHLETLLQEWEHWSAAVLASHLSYPVLSYYRSQHDNQSWLAALTAILDTCALLMTGLKDYRPFQSQLTFAMARHACVDLALVFDVPPVPPDPDRLPPERLKQLRDKLRAVGLDFRTEPAAEAKLTELRAMYEPFVNALARYFVLTLPPFDPEPGVDNWQTTAWTRRAPGIANLPLQDPRDEHFD